MLNFLKNRLRGTALGRFLKKLLLGNAYGYSVYLPEITPIIPRRSVYGGRRINLLVPSIHQGNIFGGISTAIRLIDALAPHFDSVRLIVTDASYNADDLKHFSTYTVVPSDEESTAKRQLVPFIDRSAKTLPVAAGDMFVATAWWTAYTAQRLLPLQAGLYGQPAKHLLYLIQDYEPGFYPWSSQYVLALNTYTYSGPTIGIFNTRYLYDYFKLAGHACSHEFVFEPQMHPKLRACMASPPVQRKKRVLIYGRPSVARNALPLIVEGLRLWVRDYPGASEWELVSIGEGHPSIDIGGMRLNSLGKLSLEQYADLMNGSAIGISIMISPHPSYPPLEMAHFGMRVLTNGFGTKDLATAHENILSISEMSPEGVFDGLSSLCREFDNLSAGKRPLSPLTEFMREGAEFPFLPDILALLQPPKPAR